MQEFNLKQTKSPDCSSSSWDRENTVEEVWTVICSSVALSRPIICQFSSPPRQHPGLWQNLCLIPLCLIMGAACQVRSEKWNNWWAAPPPPLLCRVLICSGRTVVEGEREGLSSGWHKRRVLMRGWMEYRHLLCICHSCSFFFFLNSAPPPQWDNKRAGGQSQGWEEKEEKGLGCEGSEAYHLFIGCKIFLPCFVFSFYEPCLICTSNISIFSPHLP